MKRNFTMKKQFSALVLLVSLLASLSACGGEAVSTDTTSDTQTTAAEDLGPFPTLPNTDLEDFTLRIASFEEIRDQYTYTEEANGDVVNDTICADLAYMNTSSGTSGLGRAFMHLITNPKVGAASYLDSIESAELATIEKLNAFFSE